MKESGLLGGLLGYGITDTVIQGSDIENRIMIIPIKGTIGMDGSNLLGGQAYDHQMILDSLDQTIKTKVSRV